MVLLPPPRKVLASPEILPRVTRRASFLRVDSVHPSLQMRPLLTGGTPLVHLTDEHCGPQREAQHSSPAV